MDGIETTTYDLPAVVAEWMTVILFTTTEYEKISSPQSVAYSVLLCTHTPIRSRCRCGGSAEGSSGVAKQPRLVVSDSASLGFSVSVTTSMQSVREFSL